MFKNPAVTQEYRRVTAAPMHPLAVAHPLIDLDDAILAYFALADYFTDPENGEVEEMLVGVRSVDLLASALIRQTVSFGGVRKYEAPLEVAATAFFGMVKNHPFADGNKRTALLLLLYQLGLYGYRPTASGEAFEALVVAVAAGELADAYPDAWEGGAAGDREVAALSRILAEMVSPDVPTVAGLDALLAVIRAFAAPLRRLKDE
jgi:prophage maintenance system killer protein